MLRGPALNIKTKRKEEKNSLHPFMHCLNEQSVYIVTFDSQMRGLHLYDMMHLI